jgi:hypothetical protein
MSDKPEKVQYKFSQKMIQKSKALDEQEFDLWIEGIANSNK